MIKTSYLIFFKLLNLVLNYWRNVENFVEVDILSGAMNPCISHYSSITILKICLYFILSSQAFKL